MQRIKIIVLAGVISLLSVPGLIAQSCGQIQSSAPDTVVAYLSGMRPDRANALCVRSAIKQLGDSRHEPAAPVLTKFLDFRWPPDAHQKQRLFVLEHDGASIYPAANALVQIGKGAVPAVLSAIKSGIWSRDSMEVALSVWMTIYKDQAPIGVALLRQESDNAAQPGERQRLGWAAYLAARDWCHPSEKAQCMAAAGGPSPAKTQATAAPSPAPPNHHNEV